MSGKRAILSMFSVSGVAGTGDSMRKLDIVKTVQLVIYVVLAAAALAIIVRDEQLYQAVASNAHVRALCAILWVLLVLSFLFLLYDLSSLSTLRSENMELDYAVNSDSLTGIANRTGCDAYIARYAERPAPSGMACATLVLTNLRDINAARGLEGGDEEIRAFARIISGASGENCFVGRNGGNKFLAIFDKCSREELDAFVSEVTRLVEEHNAGLPGVGTAFVVGTSVASEESSPTLPQLVAISDRMAMGLKRS